MCRAAPSPRSSRTCAWRPRWPPIWACRCPCSPGRRTCSRVPPTGRTARWTIAQSTARCGPCNQSAMRSERGMTMKISASVSMMFRELPLLERFAAAARAGFDGVEIQVIDEGDPAEMAQAARAAGMPVVLMNLPLGDLFAGGPGLSGVPGREAAFASAAERGLRAAREMDARFVHVGPSRIPPGHDREACLETYRRNAGQALAPAGRLAPDAVLLVEPMNSVEMLDALVASLSEAAHLEVGRES